MKKVIVICFSLLSFSTKAQNVFLAVITDHATKEPLPGATLHVKQLKLSVVANEHGLILTSNIPAGKYAIEISNTGYRDYEESWQFPLPSDDTLFIELQSERSLLEEVTVTSTRAGRSVRNTPTRVEVIAEDEVHEEATMRPGDIKMLLSESTGIQTQQTSATSANASIRIQGLDGRYTQILKDGFPVYSGAATGLGLLQTPPLDLRQVEIIKGSSSTLYGGGAISGLVNLITKLPTGKPELGFHLNATSAGGIDISSFYGYRSKGAGITLFAARNSNKPYDPAHLSFTAIPKYERYTFNPKLFLYLSEKTKLNFGINSTFEDRLGGDTKFISGNGDSVHRYFEKNETQRLSTQFTFDRQVNGSTNIKVKNSLGYFRRKINSNGYSFNGTQYSTFSEGTYVVNKVKTDWVAGVNVLTDHFTEGSSAPAIVRDYQQNTFGVFAQNTWNASPWVTLESGLRMDYVKDYGFAILPRLSTLFRIASNFSSRISAGLGYKAPTIFTEESEKLLYKNVLPIDIRSNQLERSYGANLDLSYRTYFDKVRFTVNQLFFYTWLKDPLFLKPVQNAFYRFQNIIGHTTSKGVETNIKLGFDQFTLYLGYTYIDGQVNDNGNISVIPLTPKHRLNAALVFEIEDKLRVGSELYYFSKQTLTDGSFGRSYVLTGFVAEWFLKKISLYLNFENLGDIRQTKFESIYSGSISNPVFKDIYAPLDGFVMNGGIKIRL